MRLEYRNIRGEIADDALQNIYLVVQGVKFFSLGVQVLTCAMFHSGLFKWLTSMVYHELLTVALYSIALIPDARYSMLFPKPPRQQLNC